VERIAICFWRLRRILRFDFGFRLEGSKDAESFKGTWRAKRHRIDQLAALRKKIVQNGVTDKLKEPVIDVIELDVDPSDLSDQLLPVLINQHLTRLQNELPTNEIYAEASALTSVIDGRRMDTLLRYETANERQLYRAIDQLERLQRQRAGD